MSLNLSKKIYSKIHYLILQGISKVAKVGNNSVGSRNYIKTPDIGLKHEFSLKIHFL